MEVDRAEKAECGWESTTCTGDLPANAKLEYLDACSNEIVSIEESGELLPLSLQALVLRSNRIQSVLSAKGLAGLTALEEVDLEENPFNML